MEQIYSGKYFENQNECDNNERNESPVSEVCEEAECIELDTIEGTGDDEDDDVA